MEYKDFAECIRHMAQEQGKDILASGNAANFLADYCKGEFKKEAKIFREILTAGYGKHINDADDVPDIKRKLVERLEDEHGFSPNVTAEYLDLLGLILRGDTSRTAKTREEPKAEEEARVKAESEAAVQAAPEKAAAEKRTEAAPPSPEDAADADELYKQALTEQDVNRNFEKAFKLFRMAADKGNTDAMYRVASLYNHGFTSLIAKDEAKAMEWYTKAAEQGHGKSQYNLGMMYEYKGASFHDYSKTAYWCGKAAEQEHECTGAAYSRLGILYRDGLGVPQDFAKAEEMFNKAIDTMRSMGIKPDFVKDELKTLRKMQGKGGFLGGLFR